MNNDHDIPVLIVGGSLVGLTTAMLLGMHGVRSLAVERHAGTAIHPRAGHFHLRTIEILRQAGLEPAARAASVAMYDPNGGINAVESLAGRELANYIGNLNEGVEAVSPTVRLFLNQDVLEPLLRGRATELGAEVRYGTEAIAVEQDAEGVTATVRDLATGGENRLRARYLVAADGNRSPIRERLGIAMHGYGLLSNSVTIYFRADCAPLLKDRNQGVIYVANPELRGFFRLDRSGGNGFLVVNTVGADVTRPEATEVSAIMSRERALALLRAAIGVPDMPMEVLDIAHWRAVADVAERYREGRIFLAGDAAHIVPPNGGYGGNTGVQDAQNLAWKLAMALQGAAGPALLETYDAERRPIGQLTIEQAFARYATRVVPERRLAGVKPLVDDMSMEIGHVLRSTAIVGEAGDDGALHQHPDQSRGRPGTRAPHVTLTRGGETLSALDLFGRHFVLLAAAGGNAWVEAARTAAAALAIPVDAFRVGPDGNLRDPDGRFAAAYGLAGEGAALIRPDGIVAWRAGAADTAGNPAATLTRVLAAVLSRPAA